MIERELKSKRTCVGTACKLVRDKGAGPLVLGIRDKQRPQGNAEGIVTSTPKEVDMSVRAAWCRICSGGVAEAAGEAVAYAHEPAGSVHVPLAVQQLEADGEGGGGGEFIFPARPSR